MKLSKKNLLFVLSIISFVLILLINMQWFISSQEKDAEMINLAGRQRMLSQKIAKDILSDRAQSMINESILEWRTAHLKLLDFAERQVTTLSDGEFQKTMIAKMLAQDAPVMLLDEPATHLDLPASIELLQLLKKLTSREGKTVIFSTHNIALAFRLVEKILLLDGKGSFAAGTPEELSHHALMCGFLRTDRVRVENGNLIYNFEDHEN